MRQASTGDRQLRLRERRRPERSQDASPVVVGCSDARTAAEGAALAARAEKISLVIPMLNEARHVESLTQDLAAQTYDGEMEMIVADGGSTDGSVEALRGACTRRGIPLTMLENPHGSTAHGLNRCLEYATSDLIVRLDCHTRYPPDYLELLASTSAETGAWNVGGVVEVEGESVTERAIACALDNPFGGANWSRHFGANVPMEVDTVSFGAFRREVFERVGVFDEDLVRDQDDEFNMRLRRAGGRIVLDPRIRVRYRPRGSFRALARQYYQYGRWKVPVMAKHRRILSARSLAPIGLVGSLVLLGLAATLSTAGRWAFAALVVTYLTLAAVFAARAIARRHESWSLLPLVVAALPVCHLSYGVGMCVGLARAARSLIRRSGPTGNQ